MNKQVLLIVNPKAGKGDVQKRIPEIKEDLIKTGYNVDTINTQRRVPVKNMIKEYEKKIDMIICCGGDGTVNDLVSSVMEMKEKPEISFIPLGTVNDFARTIGLSRKKFFKTGILNKYQMNPFRTPEKGLELVKKIYPTLDSKVTIMKNLS